MRLKIGDNFLDSDNSIIAQNYAVNEIGKIETKQGGFSNNFTIPLTSNNKSILGFPDDINSASRNPYEKVEATLFDNGASIAEGYLRFQIVGDALEASFFADNVNWFVLIKSKKLIDLNLSEFDHVWEFTTQTTAIAADKDSGFSYTLIDYGNNWIDLAVSPGEGPTLEVFDDELYPFIFLHSIVERIFFEAGFKANGPVLESGIFKRMVIPFSGSFTHSLEWQTDNIFSDLTNGVANFTDISSVNLVWTSSGGITFSITTDPGIYDIVLVMTVTATASRTIEVNVIGTGAVNLGQFNFVSNASGEEYTMTIENLPLLTTDTFSVNVFLTGGAGSGTVAAGATAVLTPQLSIEPGSTIQMSRIMPNMTQADLLMYVAFSFDAILQSNVLSKTVEWNYFRDVKSNSSIDWSDKIDLSKSKEVDFTELLNKFGRNSIVTYKADTTQELADYQAANEKVFGGGVLEINNEHIAEIKTVYTSPFSSFINHFSFIGGSLGPIFYMPSIPFVTNTGSRTNPVRTFLILSPKIGIVSKNIAMTSYRPTGTTLTIFERNSVGGAGNSSTVSSFPFRYFIELKTSTLSDKNLSINEFPVMFGRLGVS